MPEWKQAVLSIAVVPLLPLIVMSVIVAYALGVLLTCAMDCIDAALDFIYKDKP